MQASVGVAQLRKLPQFIAARKRNYSTLRAGLHDLQDFLILPAATLNSEPSWFGFPVMVKPDAPFSRAEIIRFLEERKIGSRSLFGGNLLRQPAYRGVPHRVAGTLENSDLVMNQAFWIGVYPGLTEAMLEYVIEAFHEFTIQRRIAIHASAKER
jgi:CDP-6-deoxy-D-xylo-4-hexulose-3-dehydrase